MKCNNCSGYGTVSKDNNTSENVFCTVCGGLGEINTYFEIKKTHGLYCFTLIVNRNVVLSSCMYSSKHACLSAMESTKKLTIETVINDLTGEK